MVVSGFINIYRRATVRGRFLLIGTILHRVHRKSVAARLTVV